MFVVDVHSHCVFGMMQRAQMLLRYFFAGRERFDGSIHNSCSVDIGRAGKKGRFLCAMITPDNDATWCPPLV